MGDVGEMWRDYKEQRSKKKRSNQEYSTKLLIESDIAFDSFNDGVHLVIKTKPKIDFWPSTGLWSHRTIGKKGRGVRNLIHYIKRYENANKI